MSSIKGKPFSVVSVEKTEPIAGTIGESWYRYILEWEHGTIVGTRCGTLQQVTSHAKAYIDDRNFRDGNPGYSIWTRRRRK
jgi:hypothetical protein